jgi:hypothetical protein
MVKKWHKTYSPKRRARLNGMPSVSDLVEGPALDRLDVAPVVPKVTIAADLKRIADALPSVPPKGRGRPRKDAPVQLSRQQLRYRERMLSKASDALQKLEGGA